MWLVYVAGREEKSRPASPPPLEFMTLSCAPRLAKPSSLPLQGVCTKWEYSRERKSNTICGGIMSRGDHERLSGRHRRPEPTLRAKWESCRGCSEWRWTSRSGNGSQVEEKQVEAGGESTLWWTPRVARLGSGLQVRSMSGVLRLLHQTERIHTEGSKIRHLEGEARMGRRYGVQLPLW